MLSSKISISVCLVLLLCSCSERKLLFNFNRDVKTSFFKEIPGVGTTTYLGKEIVKKADSIQVFRVTFSEKYIEKNNLLEYTEISNSAKTPVVRYWNVHGYSQDLYMLKYTFALKVLSRGVATALPQTGVIFFTVHKNNNDDVIGFTPCYFGIVNESFRYITFDTQLSLKINVNDFYLKWHDKNPKLPGLLFIPQGSNSPGSGTPASLERVINIEKIVRLDANKVGGKKPLVFNIHEVLRDPTALEFRYVNSIDLKP